MNSKSDLPHLTGIARSLNAFRHDFDDYRAHLESLGRSGELEKLEANVQRFWDELRAWLDARDARDREDEDNG